MGFFERPDPRLIESADPSAIGALLRVSKRHACGLGLCLIAITAAYAANIAIGLHEAAPTRGILTIPGLEHPVTIVRDRRDIAHIRAQDDRDLYFAEGFVQGSDRLFQLDMARRYSYGTLAEVLGRRALPYDEAQRAVDIRAIARRQWRALGAHDRAAVLAFSDGINTAARLQPLPVEFRMLLYRPAVWVPEDSLAVSIVASLELADSWHDIFTRDSVWRNGGERCFDRVFPLSDARYDVTVNGIRVPAKRSAPISACQEPIIAARPMHVPIGSNAWAAGAARTFGGHALIANDPHIDLTIPGIWYLVDIESPQMHVAGATIPGIPGVVLGHNDAIAWASTNAEMATTSVFEAGRLDTRDWVTERFKVRFSRDVRIPYYRTRREFSVPDENDPSVLGLVRWPIYAQTRSTIETVLALDRARDAAGALQILAQYRGSPQNFLVADRSGRVAYHVAGLVPDDPAWGRYVHRACDLHVSFTPITFARLPHRTATRDAILLSANNKPYAPGYPYRLSAQFQPPYRAYRIAQLMKARRRYDAGYFARMQLDTLSPIDLEIDRDVLRLVRAQSFPARIDTRALTMLRRWDGRYDSRSQGAALEHALRDAIFGNTPNLEAQLAQLRAARAGAAAMQEQIFETISTLAFQTHRRWRDAGRTPVDHVLDAMNFGFLNGGWLPGDGDEFTIHLQEPGFAQGFRAVWEVGRWNQGGIAIPSGESGEPGSGHYADLTHAWVRGTLEPLPYGTAAVARDASNVLVLRPQPSPV